MKKFYMDLSIKDIDKRINHLVNDKIFYNNASRLVESTYNSLTKDLGLLKSCMVKGVLSIVNCFKGLSSIRYEDYLEINHMSKYGINSKKLFLSNFIYELAKIGGSIQPPQWCSSTSKYLNGKGYIHARNMDWDLSSLKRKTIIMNYKNSPCGNFSSVTFPGYSGVITGMAKGRFSASVNMMLEDYGYKLSGKPVTFVLREVFETCKNFKEAFKVLSNVNVFAPAFVHLVGIKRGENCVIGVMTEGYRNKIYKNNNSLVITNHIPDTDFNDEEWEVDSVERYDNIVSGLKYARDYKDMNSIMSEYPVYNDMTKHTVIMNPKTGYLNVT